MAQLQVILKGESWKKSIIVGVVSVVIILIILEAWRPGTMAAIFPAAKNGAVRIFDYAGDVFESLKKLVSSISNWYR